MYQVTPKFVARFAAGGYDVWTISLWEQWLARMPDLEAIVARIQVAFAEVKLGDGVGMLEADGIDNYAGENELSELRELDERQRWQSISSADLNENYCSFGYCDGKGGLFLLPAYLLCDLRDEYNFDFVDELTHIRSRQAGVLPKYMALLNSQQASVLSDLCLLLKAHPDFQSKHEQLDLYVEAISEAQVDADPS